MTFEQRFNCIATLIDAANGLIRARQGSETGPVQSLLKAAIDEARFGAEFAAQAAEAVGPVPGSRDCRDVLRELQSLEGAA